MQPVYDADRIRARFDELTAHERDWEQWFETEKIEPLRITYETLSDDPPKTLRSVLDHLGLDRQAASCVKPDIAKLADGISHDWATRFRTERNTA